MKRSLVDESAILNNKTYLDYFYRLKELAINRYEWVNLPTEIDERFLELALCETGMAVFFWDEIANQFVALTVMIGGPLNIYRIPTYRRAYATNGYQRTLSPDDSILIFNNYLHQPCFPALELYARRLYEIERAIDVNVKGQKTPKIILSNDNQRLTLRNLYMQYDGNVPFIFGTKDLDTSAIQTLDTTSPYVADKLELLKHQIWNEALTYLGIENSNTDKRERLVTDEVTTNLGAVDSQRIIGLNARRQAARWINEMFGLNIDVTYRGGRSDREVSRETYATETADEVISDE